MKMTSDFVIIRMTIIFTADCDVTATTSLQLREVGCINELLLRDIH